MEPKELQKFAADYTAAWCSGDASSVVAFFDEGGSLVINGGEPGTGRAAIRETVQAFMSAFPDLIIEMDGVDQDADTSVYRWTLIGTNTGPDGTGKAVRISGYERWTIGPNGLVAYSDGNFDALDYERQLMHGAPGTNG